MAKLPRLCPQKNQKLNQTILILPPWTPLPHEFFPIPVRITPVSSRNKACSFANQRVSNNSNLVHIDVRDNLTLNTVLSNPNEFVPSILLTNVMSLVPKFDEVRAFISHRNLDFLFITETWLKNTVGDCQISLENYNLYRRDRFSGQHGGVCVYIKDQINSKRLAELEDPNFEVLWTYTRPTRLPRGVPCVITACVYHPPSSNDNQILDYLFNSLAKVEGLFPGCAVFMAGDFNQLDVKPLMLSFQMKQLIQHPTRGSNILDLVLTNLHKYYEPRSVEILPPFGLSDHKSIVILPKIRQSELPHKRVIVKRDTRPSRKMELGRYLSQVNWSLIENINTCQEKYDFFSRIILTGLNTIMPERAIKVHSNDAPWITTDLKRLITLRQRALSSGKSDLFKFYRNKVNKTRKLCRAKFFASRVNHLKEYKPKMWWSYVKRISGMSSSCSNLQSQL